LAPELAKMRSLAVPPEDETTFTNLYFGRFPHSGRTTGIQPEDKENLSRLLQKTCNLKIVLDLFTELTT